MGYKLGEFRRARDIGRKGGDLYVYHACEKCGKERWVIYLKGKPKSTKCSHCAASEKAPYNGGKRQIRQGYTMVYLSKKDPFYPMANKGHYSMEHRLVVARHLGRCLLPWEVVHHKNGIKNDNRLDNLILLPNKGYHNTQIERQLNKQAREIETLRNRIVQLEAEITLLRVNNVGELI
ncbi:MAG: HNH endonuclease [Limnochordia bacterium]|nr:HNH endonuclease [Limnochordia bacterium]